ncbi:MAG: hypothetical protein JNM98_02765 [Rhodocyclaceae bacterium]|nr:hypothetical protein [Rhodocyclaceae bacterium]
MKSLNFREQGQQVAAIHRLGGGNRKRFTALPSRPFRHAMAAQKIRASVQCRQHATRTTKFNSIRRHRAMGSQDDDNQASGKIGAGLGLGIVGILALVAIVFIIMGVVFSMIAGLFAVPLLMLAARIPPGGARMSFAPAYSGATTGTFLFLLIAVGLLYVLPHGMATPALQVFDHLLPNLLPSKLRPYAPWVSGHVPLVPLLMVAVPGLIAYALALRSAGAPFDDGMLGFLRGMLAAVPALAVGLGCAGNIVALALERAASRHMLSAAALEPLLYTAIFALVFGFLFALVAALVAGGVIAFVSRWLWRHPEATFRRAYGTAFFALLAYLAVTGFVIFLLPNDNPLFPEIAATLGRHASHHQHVGAALLSFLLAQLPGLAILAAIVAGGLAGTYRGVAGYGRALVASAAGVAAVGIATIATSLVITNA